MKKLRELAHQFAISYEPETKESREKCIDKFLKDIQAYYLSLAPEKKEIIDSIDYQWQEHRFETGYDAGIEAYREAIGKK